MCKNTTPARDGTNFFFLDHYPRALKADGYTVRAQARFRRQIGVLRSTVAVYIASNGGNDEEDC